MPSSITTPDPSSLSGGGATDGGEFLPGESAHAYEFKDFAGSSHRILIDLIRAHARPDGRLLDLGASAGELGAAVRDRFAQTIACELVLANLGPLSARFDRVVIADLEQMSRLPSRMDAIVMADVLEHVKHPPALLARAIESLNSKGRLFISVPNVANIAIRVSLLLGRFDYAERGILDSTHLRFYTRRTARRELEKAGLTIVAERASILPIRLVFKSIPGPVLSVLERLLGVLTRLWPTLLGYQFIFVAERR